MRNRQFDNDASNLVFAIYVAIIAVTYLLVVGV